MYRLHDGPISVPFNPDSFQIELARPASEQVLEKLACTYRAAAEALSVSESTVKRLVKKGDLEVLAMGRATRVTIASLQRFAQRGSAASCDS